MGYVRDMRASRAPMPAFAAMGMVWAGIAAQLPALKAQIGASDAGLGLSFMLANLGALTAPWLATRADRALGARSLMVVTLLMGAVFLMVGLVSHLASFTLVIALAAAAPGTADVLMNARVSEIEARARRSLMALNHAVYSLVYAATALAVGLAREAGAGPLAVFAAIFAVIALAVPVMRCRHDAAAGRRAGRARSWCGSAGWWCWPRCSARRGSRADRRCIWNARWAAAPLRGRPARRSWA
ncbi:MAG TPA: hypothetical protein DEA05_01215 [Rhodobacteraceae bacterium]|nr:hypothetical protein [Paracoccaceae bacterium]